MNVNTTVFLLKRIFRWLKRVLSHRMTPWVVIALLLFLPRTEQKPAPQFKYFKKPADFAQAKPSNIPPVPDSIFTDASPAPEEAYHGEGSVAVCDTVLPVTIEIIEFEDEPPFVLVEVGDSIVTFDSLYHYEIPPPRWRGCVEAVPIGDNWEAGVGVGYRLFSTGDYNWCPAVIVGDTWIAGEMRCFRYITNHVSIDIGAGYRLGEEEGLHIGVGVGVDL